VPTYLQKQKQTFISKMAALRVKLSIKSLLKIFLEWKKIFSVTVNKILDWGAILWLARNAELALFGPVCN